jgi:cyclic-di-GMP-binding protein
MRIRRARIRHSNELDSAAGRRCAAASTQRAYTHDLAGTVPLGLVRALNMPENTFDIASKIDLNEVLNAIQQTSKEIQTRYDLKDSKSSVELNEKDRKILLASSDEYKLKAVTEILGQKLVKRNVPLKGLQYGTIVPASQGSVRQEITLQQGIPIEKARDIVKTVKESKLKVQASIQGDVVRISGKDRDTLQQVIALLKGKDFGIDMQFTNYRSN